MAKKKETVSEMNETPAAKKEGAAKKNAVPAKKNAGAVKKNAGAVKKSAAAAKKGAGAAKKNAVADGGRGSTKAAELEKKADARDLWIREFTSQLEEMIVEFNDGYDIETNLTGVERKRLTSARVRNNGFIDKAFDVARDNPDFLPPHFDSWSLSYKMRDLEDLRQLMAVMDQFQRSITDAFIIQADSCFKDALRIYGSLNEQRRARVPGAAALFELLSVYFKTRRRTATETTAKELERDVKRLLKGTADGEIVIKNEAPRMTGGIHEVLDNVRTGRSSVKASVDEEVDEGASARKK